MDRFDDMKVFIERMRTDFNEKLDELKKQDEKYRSITYKRSNCINLPRFQSYKSDLSEDDRRNIKNFYQNCPDGYHVDHIIPLSRGGKHHISNLQYLTAEQNREKGNKLHWEKREKPKMIPIRWDDELKTFVPA